MPEHERKLGLRKLAIEDMQIGAAHPAGRDLDQNLVRTGAGTGNSAALSGVPARSSTIACMVAEGMAPSPLGLGRFEALISVQREAELLAHHLGALKRQRMRW